ncbi:MAG: amidohydrolase family protein [Cyclobacteriaceae bacterium]
MSKIINLLLLSTILSFAISCSDDNPKADLVIKNGTVYTVNEAQPTAEAIAVVDDKIVYVGSNAEIETWIADTTKVIDLAGKTITPGLIEGHAHIMGVGYNRLNLDLMETKSYEDIVNAVTEASKTIPEGEWILGRGWHQDKWTSQPENKFNGFPTHHDLSAAAPNHPVYLRHASGHLGFANQRAMELAGITRNSPQPDGGEIFMGLDGEPTGIFNETAQGLIGSVVPENTPERNRQALELAIKECVENGITSFHSAGNDGDDIQLIKDFIEEGKMNIRLYVMLNGRNEELLQQYYEKGPEIGVGDNRLTVRSIKLYSDGALGSRGAWLLEEYTDAPGQFGHNVTPMEDIERITMDGTQNGFQICTHAIGDRGNQEVFDIYEKAFEAYPDQTKDHRFRIEHAQHLSLDDIPRFAELGVIPAMQAIHMSSDRPWAIDRLGKKRIEDGAYVWQTLLQSGAKIVNGTDAPVEPINPIPSFYASVSRRTLAGTPEGGYEPDQKMTRAQALKSYTLDAAYGAFEEEIKGSIEVGKLADFTVFDQDIMQVAEDELLETTVAMTIVGGEVVFSR